MISRSAIATIYTNKYAGVIAWGVLGQGSEAIRSL